MKATLVTVFVLLLITAHGQSIRFTSGHDQWNADSLGNIRAVVISPSAGRMAKVVIPWRRPDTHPENKRIIVQDGQTGNLITNTYTGILNNESGELWFEPASGKGIYYVYYMPYKNEGRSNYPRGVYLAPNTPPVSDTKENTKANTKTDTKADVKAIVREIEYIDSFNSFYPMEVIATADETRKLLHTAAAKDYLVFPEDRTHPIKMTDHLPLRWTEKPYTTSFDDTASRGEFYSYQLGVYALTALKNVRVTFSDLRGPGTSIIPNSQSSCINNGGTDYTGKPFTKTVDIPAGIIQPLWCLLNIPASASAGHYTGTATIEADGLSPKTITLHLTIKPDVLADGGIANPQEQTRLHWLNSTLMQENIVIAPYTPLQLDGRNIGLLGRKLLIGADGLPARIQTFFTPEMTGYADTPNNLISDPIHFVLTDASHQPIDLKAAGPVFTKQEAGTIEWAASSTNNQLRMDVNGHLEFDGFLSYQVKIAALQDIALDDISLLIPFRKNMAKYMMGLGLKGGNCPDNYDWKWQVATKNQDGAWIGSVNAGLQYSLRDENYTRPLNTNFYLQKPLLLPTSWGNAGNGGIRLTTSGNTLSVQNFSGSRTLHAGDTLFYNITFLITPFHPLNTDFQWANRFYHRYNDIDSIHATGATIVNIHHATPINPWINYPFIEWKAMKGYIDEAHSKGLKVKIYNTVRELSDHAYELFPMRSLGHEIYSTGKGGGFSWLQEHVKEDYIPAWFVPEIKDAALINSGMSRWHNYYVEGMNWLVQNVGIDGIYLDDVAFDRVTMKRIKRVLTLDGHPGIIDLHSANQYNKSDGFNNSANLYMEHFPYLNRLWFGEYFDYEKNDPAFFLTEVSGIPFGLMGEMLQGGGNPWRGMVYGMTNRMPWSDNADPRPIWKVWDSFGMQGSEMIGYWSGHCPVSTSDSLILATVFRKKDAALVAIGSWAPADTTVHLNINWKALGIDSANATITAPAIPNFQPAATFNASSTLPIPKNKGLLLIITATPKTTITETEQTLPTYGFSDPSPIPLLTPVYPYFRYDGFTSTSTPKKWKVVTLENKYLRLLIFPQIGGKVWTAIEKSTNRPFLYYNHTVKFRDIAMRGPWTSGGLEANFGIMGHTPATATPVDYTTRINNDGSASCFIGCLDLLTHSYWRVEIHLPADQALFTTTATWYNTTPIAQPYYHWMNAGLKASDDLEFIFPGNKYLGHAGEYASWPINKDNNKTISWYKNNDFGGYKSYHVFGQYADFSGAYWHLSDLGTVRYATHDDKAGKKIWIWGLSRQGMIWERLLTDTDGQYVETQSGRLFNQNGERSSLTPFKHRDFQPYETDSWKESWYPVLDTKGFVAASEYGALNLRIKDNHLYIDFCPTQTFSDTLRIRSAGKILYERALHFQPLQHFSDSIALEIAHPSLVATIGNDKLIYQSDPSTDSLSRPVDAPADFDWTTAYGYFLKGCEALDQKFYPAAEQAFDSALAKDHNFLPALIKQAGLYYRNMRYKEALTLAKHALSIDTEDGEANYIYGLINEQLGQTTDAKDGFDIAGLDPAWRSAAETRLAHLALRDNQTDKAMRSTEKALAAQPQNIDALQLRALIARLQGNDALHESTLQTILAIDPLNFFARFEQNPDSFTSYIRSELPQETYLELGIWYADLGLKREAIQVLQKSPAVPEVRLWLSSLTQQPVDVAALDPVRSFPFRSETAALLEQLIAAHPQWFLRYQLALIYQDRNRTGEALTLLSACGDEPHFAPFYATRAAIETDSAHIEHDLRQALQLDPSWRFQKLLAEFCLQHNRNDDAQSIAAAFYTTHPGSYIMGMLYAKTLLLTHHYAECDHLLAQLTIIPFEGATASHELYREAKLMQAVACIKKQQFKKALTYIAEARQWPENLGVGEPYPENEDLHLEDSMSYRCYTALHQTAAAKAALDRIHPGPSTPNEVNARVSKALE